MTLSTLAVLGCSTLLPASAFGWSATLNGSTLDMNVGGNEVNDISISDGSGGTVEIFDSATDFAGGVPGVCSFDGPGSPLVCPAGSFSVVAVGTGDLGDTVTVSSQSVSVQVDGGTGDDTLYGGVGADTLNGGDGSDTLDGGPGTDTLNGGDGVDNITGGDNSDTITGGGGNDTLDGADGGDTLNGNDGDDQLDSGAGNDSLTGDAGDDTLSGGSDQDLLDGGAGLDSVSGDNGDDTVNGGDGDDTVTGDSGNDTVDGGAGVDSLQGGSGTDTLSGGTENDDLQGDSGTDTLNGDAGDDTLDGGTETDHLLGGDGNDVLSTEGGSDLLEGGDGNDELNGGTGPSTLLGGIGNDTLQGSNGNEILKGENDSDIVDGGMGADQLSGGDGEDTVTYADRDNHVQITFDDGLHYPNDGENGEQDSVAYDFEIAVGGSGDDFLRADLYSNSGPRAVTLRGGDGNDYLGATVGIDKVYGEGGDDLMSGDSVDADYFYGGEGTDTVSYANRAYAVFVDQNGLADDGWVNEGDLVGSDVENIIGSSAADTIIGGANIANTIVGGAGDDKIDVRSNDAEADTAQCGDGTDKVQSDSLDTVADDCEDIFTNGVQTKFSTSSAYAPLLYVLTSRVRVGREGVVIVKLRCGERTLKRCVGKLTLLPKRGGKAVGSAKFRIPSGQSKAVRVRISAATVRRLRKEKRLRGISLQTSITVQDPYGHSLNKTKQLRVRYGGRNR